MLNTNKNPESQNSRKVVTRIAPSPTGVLHIGTARTALFNYLYAKKHGGKFILRIEDTDRERSTPEFEKDILNGLQVLGLTHDVFYKQSERIEIYQKYIDKLIKDGKAFVSKEESGERSEVIRLKNPNTTITFNDEVRGEISFDTTELGDFVIAKSLTEPLYHLAVVVDDYEMGVTHIIRGDDGISNTPRQILIQEAIGAPRPNYAHIPLILGPDRSKLSKRHGATSMDSFFEKGYLTDAIINQLAFLGWNPGTDQELFSLDELIEVFSLDKVQKGGAIFNEEKLKWFNHQYLQKMSDEDFVEKTKKYFTSFATTDQQILKLKNILLERIDVLSDIEKMISAGELNYFFQTPNPQQYGAENLIWKKSDQEKTTQHLEEVVKLINSLDESPDTEQIKSAIWPYAEENGKGDVLWPLRYALSGLDKSPDPLALIAILGKNESLNRISAALQALKSIKSA